MSFALCSKIKIGRFTLKGGFNDLKLKKSVAVIMDSGSIDLPTTATHGAAEATFKNEGRRMSTAEVFKEGDPIKIELGYNDVLRTEFEGFVAEIKVGKMVRLELEGYGYQLRKVRIIKSWRKTNVKEVLREIIKGTDITLSPAIPNIPLEKFTIPNQTGLDVLQRFKDDLKLTAFFNGKELYVGLEQGLIKKPIKYKLGWNTIEDDFSSNTNQSKKLLVKVWYKDQNKKKMSYKAGDKGGDTLEIKLPFINSLDTVKRVAEQALRKNKEKRYTGSFTTFLQPYCEPGYKAEVEDAKFNKRGGAYFVDSVHVTFGMRGARRKIEVSSRLD